MFSEMKKEIIEAGILLDRYALIAVLLVTVPLNRHRLRNMDGTFSKRYRDYRDGAYD